MLNLILIICIIFLILQSHKKENFNIWNKIKNTGKKVLDKTTSALTKPAKDLINGVKSVGDNITKVTNDITNMPKKIKEDMVDPPINEMNNFIKMLKNIRVEKE